MGSEEKWSLAFENPTEVIQRYSHQFSQQIFKEYLLFVRSWECNGVEVKDDSQGGSSLSKAKTDKNKYGNKISDKLWSINIYEGIQWRTEKGYEWRERIP